MADYAYFRGEEKSLRTKRHSCYQNDEGDDCEKIKLLKLNVDTGEEENWISTRNYPYLMPDDTHIFPKI